MMKLLQPGMRVKRWVALIFVGLLFTSLGFAYILTHIYRVQPLPEWAGVLTLQFIDRLRQRGPKIVAVGGGTGLSVALRGLKAHTSNLTAIVTVADDGGSSGRLRRDLGVLPPGDFRNCMVALADVEPLMEDLFQYRFNHGSELDGHSFGNLFIV